MQGSLVSHWHSIYEISSQNLQSRLHKVHENFRTLQTFPRFIATITVLPRFLRRIDFSLGIPMVTKIRPFATCFKALHLIVIIIPASQGFHYSRNKFLLQEGFLWMASWRVGRREEDRNEHLTTQKLGTTWKCLLWVLQNPPQSLTLVY